MDFNHSKQMVSVLHSSVEIGYQSCQQVATKINRPDLKKQTPTASMPPMAIDHTSQSQKRVTVALTQKRKKKKAHVSHTQSRVTWAKRKRLIIGRRESRRLKFCKGENGVVGDHIGNCLFLRAQTNLQAHSQDSASPRRP